jgi:hypothetical protein
MPITKHPVALAAESAAPTATLRFTLPLELWTLVFSHTSQADLSALSLASHQLRALAVPALLHTVLLWHPVQLLSFLRFVHHSLAARAAHLRSLTLLFEAIYRLSAVSEAQLAAVVAGAQGLHTVSLPCAERVLQEYLDLARALAGRASLRTLRLDLGRPGVPGHLRNPPLGMGMMLPTRPPIRAHAPPPLHLPLPMAQPPLAPGVFRAHAPPPHGVLVLLRAHTGALTRLALTGPFVAWAWPPAVVFPAVCVLTLHNCLFSMAALARAFPAVSEVYITRYTLAAPGTSSDSTLAWPRLRALTIDTASASVLRVAHDYARLTITPTRVAGGEAALESFLARGLPASVVLPASLRRHGRVPPAEHWRGRLCALDFDAGPAAPRELCPFVAALVAAGCALQYIHLRATAGAGAPWPCDERVDEAAHDIARTAPALEVLEVSWPVLPSVFGARAPEGGHGWLLVRNVESKREGAIGEEVDRQQSSPDSKARIVLKVMDSEEGHRRRAWWFE